MAADPHRRAVLLGAFALALGGCAAPTAGPGGPTAGTTRRTTTAPSSPSPTAPDVPVAPTTPPPSSPGFPGREEILAAYSEVAPTSWGLAVPGVLSQLPATARGAALTLDYCGGPGGSGFDRSILDFLRRHGLPATLFLNARWIAANPGPAREMAEDPLFELANHGTHHLPLSVTGQSAYGIPGTGGIAEVYDEIMTNAHTLEELTGYRPRFFRSGTAHLDDVAASVCRDLGMIPAGFTVNGDAGATYPADVVVQEVSGARARDVIIAHGNQPVSGTGAGLAEALVRLKDNGISLVSLSEGLNA